MPTVKQISIKSATSATGYDTREIGAEAINVEVQYDASGNIITDLSTQNPDPSKTESLAKVLDNKAPEDHADTTTKYGAASQTEYGHVKIGAGLDVTNGEVSVKYGTAAGTAVEGNDTRLSDDRKNPNALSFADGTSYDGSVAKSIDADSVGAAVKNHASATDEFGAGTQTMFGHVKVSDVYNTDLGTASTSLAASQHAIYEVYQEAIRGSGSAGRELTKAEYDALTPDEKSNGTIYFITDWNQGGGGGNANIIALTRAQYDALPATKLTDDVLYLITDEGLMLEGATAIEISFDDGVTQLGVANVQKAIEKLADARNITFNNALTGIEATNVQDAIDYAIEHGGGSGDGVGGSLFSIYSDVFTNNPVQAVVIHADTDHGDYDGEESKVVVFKPTTDPNEQAFGAYKASLYFEAVGEIEIRVYSLDRSKILKTKTVGAHTYNHYLVKMDSHYFEDVLVAAGYSASDYASLTDLFADEIATRKVMTLHASVDALFNWGHDHETEENFDSLFNNDIAMKWLGLRDYACDKFMSYEPFKTKMLESQYWERILKDHVPVMTSNTAPYGTASCSSYYSNQDIWNAWRAFGYDDNEIAGDNRGWLAAAGSTNAYVQYKFINPINVKKFRVRADYGVSGNKYTAELYGSNDGINWSDIITSVIFDGLSKYKKFDNAEQITDNNYYMYLRVVIKGTVDTTNHGSRFYFYGRQLNVSVPVMTSNTAPWGEAIGNKEFSDGGPFKAFDKDADTFWYAKYEDGKFLGYDFNKPIKLGFVSIKNRNFSGVYIVNFKIQGSNDKLTWYDLGEFTNTVTTSGGVSTYKVDTENYYKCFRMVMLSGIYDNSNTGAYYQIGELQFYGVDYSEREFEEGSTMKYIYDHGVELEELIAQTSSGQIATKESSTLYMNKTGVASSYAGFITNLINGTFKRVRCIIGNNFVYSANSNTHCLAEYSSKQISPDSSNMIGYKLIGNDTALLPNNEYESISSISSAYYAVQVSTNNGTQAGTMNIEEWWLE